MPHAYLSLEDFLLTPWLVADTTHDLVRAPTSRAPETGRVTGVAGRSIITKTVPGYHVLVALSWFCPVTPFAEVADPSWARVLEVRPARVPLLSRDQLVEQASPDLWEAHHLGLLLRQHCHTYILSHVPTSSLVGPCSLPIRS